ncbi:hypothetical protein BpHYR1_015661 [Brachionus plicatilis]|uniref:Uncharacterized protein n=1 Tax=Brachionus plicatilis TaxID=10195 RepID=A0A3M7RIF7_BRAPC|nr:hypothetical protein BpHYR1_015661 [Brachionus plicatilis]
MSKPMAASRLGAGLSDGLCLIHQLTSTTTNDHVILDFTGNFQQTIEYFLLSQILTIKSITGYPE